jgi:hypothetical protein
LLAEILSLSVIATPHVGRAMEMLAASSRSVD